MKQLRTRQTIILVTDYARDEGGLAPALQQRMTVIQEDYEASTNVFHIPPTPVPTLTTRHRILTQDQLVAFTVHANMRNRDVPEFDFEVTAIRPAHHPVQSRTFPGMED